MVRFWFICILVSLTTSIVEAQKNPSDVVVIEFSGMVFYEDENGAPAPLPYANVFVKGTNRGSATDQDGFFSFVALPGETVVFSMIGFKTVEIIIPDTLMSEQYKWIQIMSVDNYVLPTAIIMPWPSRDHFKQELLAIDISNELKENAKENLASDKLSEIRYSVPSDGRESSSIVIKQQATDYVYTGQIKPQNIFNPVAWKKFIDAWKRGDFKKKN
ncbi:MAG: carboxypeptidase-like regulatory domain-containing protein [Saprospiraceae bacterium]